MIASQSFVCALAIEQDSNSAFLCQPHYAPPGVDTRTVKWFILMPGERFHFLWQPRGIGIDVVALHVPPPSHKFNIFPFVECRI